MSRNFSWIRHIFGNESISPEVVAKANLLVGILTTVSPLVVMTLFSTRVLPIPREWMYVQAGVGIILVLGAFLIRIAPSYYRPIAIMYGLIFCVLPFAYTAMMWHALGAYSAAHSSMGRIRFGHAPGILAVCMAYGLKLLSDPMMVHSRPLQRRIVQSGFALGAALDIVLVYLMFSSFTSMFDLGFQH